MDKTGFKPFSVVAAKSGVDGIRFSPQPDALRAIGVRAGAVIIMLMQADDVCLPVTVIATASGSGGYRLTPPLPICRFLGINSGDLVEIWLKVAGYVDKQQYEVIAGRGTRG